MAGDDRNNDKTAVAEEGVGHSILEAGIDCDDDPWNNGNRAASFP